MRHGKPSMSHDARGPLQELVVFQASDISCGYDSIATPGEEEGGVLPSGCLRAPRGRRADRVSAVVEGAGTGMRYADT